jgi:hypothetical protein
MSIFQATTFYNIQPPAAAAAGFVVRPDSFSSSVRLALPCSLFSAAPISMAHYYSDISAVVRGSGTNLVAAPTGSATEFKSDTPNNFSANGYNGSLYTQDAGSWAQISPSALGVSNNQFVFEGWFYFTESWDQPPFWHSFARQRQDIADDLFIDIGTGGIDGGTIVRQRIILNGSQFFTSTFTVTLNTWVHVAWVRGTAGALRGYYNGTRRTMGTSTANVGTSGLIRILGGNSAANDGEAATHQDLRITIGTDRGYSGATITTPSSIITNA